MRSRPVLTVLLLVTAGLTGCIGAEVSPDEASIEPLGDDGARADVVLAIIDGGINLYHDEFQATDRWHVDEAGAQGQLPSFSKADGSQVLAPAHARAPVLDKLPVTPTPVELTAGQTSWAKTVRQDEPRLLELERDTLYSFPGTKVLAGISMLQDPGPAGQCVTEPQCHDPDRPVILDHGNHGTWGAGRAVGNTFSIPGQDPGVWIVLIQATDPDAVLWAAEQPWIDMIQISGGVKPVGPGIAPMLNTAVAQEEIEAVDQASQAKPVFLAAQNGQQPFHTWGYPTWTEGYSGVPDAISVGANDNKKLAQWANQDPYVAADACANPVPMADSLSEIDNHGFGTSFASPFAAGGAAKMLVEARRLLGDDRVGPREAETPAPPEGAWSSGNPGDTDVVLASGDGSGIEKGPLADGLLTLREFKDVLYHTALITPTVEDSDGEECEAGHQAFQGWPPPLWWSYVDTETVPEDARFPFQGYGEINQGSIQAAVGVLAGTTELPERASDDQQFARAHAMKSTVVTHEPEAPGGPDGSAPGVDGGRAVDRMDGVPSSGRSV